MTVKYQKAELFGKANNLYKSQSLKKVFLPINSLRCSCKYKYLNKADLYYNQVDKNDFKPTCFLIKSGVMEQNHAKKTWKLTNYLEYVLGFVCVQEKTPTPPQQTASKT